MLVMTKSFSFCFCFVISGYLVFSLNGENVKPIFIRPPRNPKIGNVLHMQPLLFNSLPLAPFRPLARLRSSEVNLTSSTTEPLVLSNNLTDHQSENLIEHANKGFIDWLLQIIGLRPPGPGTPGTFEPPKHCLPCTCGLAYKNVRIVGGIETQVNMYPWMTALMYNSRFYCGASLINNKYLLTAGHCVSGFTPERLSATFLDHDRSNSFETKTFTRKISKIIKHKSYGSGGLYNNDIALLKLDQEVPLTGLMRPVCLPTLGKSFTGHTGIATGWGATREHGQVSNVLREVSVPILSNAECRKTGYGDRITDNMLCAGFPDGEKDACQGDSGGPLHVTNSTKFMVAGVVSWGEGCAQKNHPGVYTRVNRYITWIKSNTQDACYC